MGAGGGWDARVDIAAHDTEQRVQHEHEFDRSQLLAAGGGKEIRRSSNERAQSPGQSADEAVAREHSRSIGGRHVAREDGMLQRHEHADAAARRIDGAGKCDDQQHGVGVDH